MSMMFGDSDGLDACIFSPYLVYMSENLYGVCEICHVGATYRCAYEYV